MKLLYLIKGLGLGGAEKHVAQLAFGFRQRGHEVAVAYVLPYKSAWVPRLQAGGIEVTCLGDGSHWGVSMWPAFRRLVAEYRPDVVHAHLPISGVLARAWKGSGGYSLVYTEHNELSRLHPMTTAVHKLSRRLDDAAISCSEAVAKSLPWPSLTVDNGIGPVPGAMEASGELRERLGIGSQAIVALCVANMTPKKNHAMLLRAFDTAAQQSPADLHLVLVGQDATMGEELRRQAKQLAAADRVHFYGAHPDAQSLMKGADLFVLSSNHEGLPISLLEAMSEGLTPLVTDAGGMGAVVTDECGAVIPVGDEEALTRELLRLTADGDGRKRLGEAARRRVEELFSETRMLDQIERVYDDVLGRNSGER